MARVGADGLRLDWQAVFGSMGLERLDYEGSASDRSALRLTACGGRFSYTDGSGRHPVAFAVHGRIAVAPGGEPAVTVSPRG